MRQVHAQEAAAANSRIEQTRKDASRYSLNLAHDPAINQPARSQRREAHEPYPHRSEARARG